MLYLKLSFRHQTIYLFLGIFRIGRNVYFPGGTPCNGLYGVPWVPEAFHARFPVSARVFGLRATELLVAREKKSLVPRVIRGGSGRKGYLFQA